MTSVEFQVISTCTGTFGGTPVTHAGAPHTEGFPVLKSDGEPDSGNQYSQLRTKKGSGWDWFHAGGSTATAASFQRAVGLFLDSRKAKGYVQDSTEQHSGDENLVCNSGKVTWTARR